jgi:hypothetical protein
MRALLETERNRPFILPIWDGERNLAAPAVFEATP